MLIITKKIDEILKLKGLTRNKISKQFNFNKSALNAMATGKSRFSERVMNEILPFLGVEEDVFKGWILADKHPVEVLELAIKYKKEKSLDDKRVFTTRIDERLKSMNLSRTAFSKVINYSQGGLNEIILGRKTLSKAVMKKLCQAFDLPESEIQSWLVADKYSFKTLEVALYEAQNKSD